MVKRTKTELGSEITTQFADNTTGDITAGRLRTYLGDINDSLANVADVMAGHHLTLSAVDGVLEQSSIIENSNEIDIDKPAVFRPRINIGASELRVLGELIYFATGVTNRSFTPAGAPFDTNGTSNLMYVKLETVEQLPAAANQTVRDQVQVLTAGQSMSFTQPGATGTSHIARQFVIDLTQAGDVRLEIFAGNDATGRKLVDQTFTGLIVGENTLLFDTYPFINPSITYFVRYTAITDVSIRGTIISTVFFPYNVVTGWPYSEVRVLTNDDAAHIVDLIEALTGDDRLDYNALRNLPATGAAPLVSTNLPVDAAVTSGVWNRTSFDGVHFLLDSSEVTGVITTINAAAGTTFGNDSFFAISNVDTTTREFTLDATVSPFSGVASGRTLSLPAQTTTLFFSDLGTPAPIANYAVGAIGADHPVLVARDTPSIATLATIAAASIAGNSGLWVIAADQIDATESGVSSSVQIRALGANLLDSNGVIIPTTATAKSGIVLARGTIVRVFSSTDLRVVSTPMMAQGSLYPDLTQTGILLHINTQTLYNRHRNRTTVFSGSLNVEVRMFQVQFPNTEGILISFEDVFGFRNDGTGTVTVRAFQVGTTFSDGSTQIVLNNGDAVYVRPRVPTVANTGLFEIVQQGQAAGISAQYVIRNDWYRDGTDSTAVDNTVRLHTRQDVVDGNVRDHIISVTATNNPVVLRFEHRNIQDDRAWVALWEGWGFSVPPVGPTIFDIRNDVPIAVTWVENNITDSSNFEINDPNVTHLITSITFLTGQTVRVNIDSALISYMVVLDVIRISGSTVAANNGDWAITTIYPDRLAFEITIPGSSAANNTGPAGLLTRPLYGRTALVADDLRQANVNLFRNSARNNPVTVFPSDWFDLTTDPAPVGSLINIGYNNDLAITSSALSIEDDAEVFFQVKGGSRGNITLFDNRTSYNSGDNPLPVNVETINIDTLGTARFYIAEFPDHLEVGETRNYRINSYDINDNDDVRIFVGDPSSRVTFDEGFEFVDVINGTGHTIQLYNDGTQSGARLISPLSKNVPTAPLWSTPISADGAQINPLPISLINVIADQNEDTNGYFFNVGSINPNRLTLRAAADYTFEASLDVLFNGTQPSTGLLFVPITLMPVRVRSGGSADLDQFADTVSLLFSRNGLSGTGAPKFSHTLRVRFEWQGLVDDQISFQLRFGTFPAGFSTADIQLANWRWTATAELNLN